MLKLFQKIIFLTVFVIPIIIMVTEILSGNISLWYDKARDLLSAWDNLEKLTLIGPTSGIPGIFYGPYWIWLLSLGMLFSKDPKIITLIVQTLPYAVLFPLILYKYKRAVGLISLVVVWIYFIFSVGLKYATDLWNPFLTPLFFLFLVYLLFERRSSKAQRHAGAYLMLTGFTAGIIINFHISFGIGVFLGTVLFLLIDLIFENYNQKNPIKFYLKSFTKSIVFFAIGFGIAFLPSIIFEIRHGFNQIQTVLYAFSKYGAVVEASGFTKEAIIERFFSNFSMLLQVEKSVGYIIQLVIFLYLLYLFVKNKIKFDKYELRLLILIFIFAFCILFIYLTARNPVLGYHFYGTEILYVLLIALVIKKSILMRVLFITWAIYIFIVGVGNFAGQLIEGKKQIVGLNEVTEVVKTIENDAVGESYSFFAYSPSIYIYEYSYVFRWQYNKNVPHDPGMMPKDSRIVYVVVPKDKNNPEEGFISYVTPSKSYRTVKIFEVGSNINILRREKIN